MYDGRLVREAQFERVSDLQLSTVCLAANRARDQLSQLLGRELTLDVFAPALVRSGTDHLLFSYGAFYVARGTICDVAVVFRNRDGRRLAASAFGEDCGPDEGPLSALEERALKRIAEELIPLCTPFCGELGSLARGDVDAVIGIGLSRDPGPAFGATIERTMLAGIPLEVRAEFAEAWIDAKAVAAWTVGTTVKLDTKIGAPTKLKTGGIVIAVGDCGVRAQANAVSITSTQARRAAKEVVS
jgi:hypothetical protein